MTVIAPHHTAKIDIAELDAVVNWLARAVGVCDWLMELDALNDIDELWAHVRPSVLLREGPRFAERIDECVEDLHRTEDAVAREVACRAISTALRSSQPIGPGRRSAAGRRPARSPAPLG
jgi:hypothetical protein